MAATVAPEALLEHPPVVDAARAGGRMRGPLDIVRKE